MLLNDIFMQLLVRLYERALIRKAQMSLYKKFKTNTDIESQGVEIALQGAENPDGTVPTFLISRMGGSNKAYTKALERGTKPFRRQNQMGMLPEETLRPIVRKAFCETVLKGWRNVLDENDQPISYSEQNALKLMTDLPDVYEILQQEAMDLSNFRDKAIEAEAKNS